MINGAVAAVPASFHEAKLAACQIYEQHRKTVYCDCSYDQQGRIDWSSCGYDNPKAKIRSRKIEWEHVVPAHVLGRTLGCWQGEGCRSTGKLKSKRGRKCCQKVSPLFVTMENDLHNLVPALKELNRTRRDFSFSVLPYLTDKAFGQCEFKVDKAYHLVEPREAVRGMIARAYLYMVEQYHIAMPAAQLAQYEAWHQQYPPDKWEIKRNQAIMKKQGNSNRFIQKWD